MNTLSLLGSIAEWAAVTEEASFCGEGGLDAAMSLYSGNMATGLLASRATSTRCGGISRTGGMGLRIEVLGLSPTRDWLATPVSVRARRLYVLVDIF